MSASIIAVQFSDGTSTKWTADDFETSGDSLIMRWPGHVAIVPFAQVFVIDITEGGES